MQIVRSGTLNRIDSSHATWSGSPSYDIATCPTPCLSANEDDIDEFDDDDFDDDFEEDFDDDFDDDLDEDEDDEDDDGSDFAPSEDDE